jgi:hypothetical protein
MKQYQMILFIFHYLLSVSAEAQTNIDSLSPVVIKDITQPAPEQQNTLSVLTELRTRSEFRYGYRNLPSGDTLPAFFTLHRTRLTLDYKSKKIDLGLSLQESRTWGQVDPRNPTVPISFFEAYAEPKLNDNISFRIGRQRVMYDNQRLFAENDWRNAANAHDAFRFIYTNKKDLHTEFLTAYNQHTENVFTTNFAPTGFTNYKTLNLHYLKYHFHPDWHLVTLNVADGFQKSGGGENYKTTYMRYTSGGHLTYSKNNWTALVMAYYQYGRDSTGNKISAYFLNPEIKWNKKLWTVKLGAEIMSGQDASKPFEKDNSFVPLYGVAHRFNGNLDFFTTFPTDLNNAGLVNPYLLVWYQRNKLFMRLENHLFFMQNNFLENGVVLNKYLGFENDWRLNYIFTKEIELEFGACWAVVTNSLVAIKKSGDSTRSPFWTYLSFKFTPQLAKFHFDTK